MDLTTYYFLTRDGVIRYDELEVGLNDLSLYSKLGSWSYNAGTLLWL